MVSANTFGEIHAFVKAQGPGRVLCAPFEVFLSKHEITEQDIILKSSNRASIVAATNAQGTPDQVIEIPAPSTRRRDLGEKRACN
jgi:Uma2 family endonuclease